MGTAHISGNAVLLPRLSELLARQMGLHFPPERWVDLLRGITAAARDFHFPDADTCMQWLLSAPLTQSQIETLASHLTIGETYFFREKEAFDALREHILPALIEARRQSGKHLRIWSAGCSTGEEAYSIAILVQRLIPDYKTWNITILGTDLNPHALRKAAAGVYSDWSFRNPPSWLRSEYFRPTGDGRYEIIPQIREMVTFSYLNLVEDFYPSLSTNTNAMDFIFCRNVLMYFKPQLAAMIVSKHHQTLVDDGWLIVNPSEASPSMFGQFAIADFPGVVLYRKTMDGTAPGMALNKETTISETIPGQGRLTQLDVVGVAVAPLLKMKSHLPAPSIKAHAKSSALQSPVHQNALPLYLQGHYAAAKEATTRLLASYPHDANAMSLMVRIHANLGELPVALQWSERAIAAERMNPVGHYLRAAILQEQGLADEAVQSLKRTLYLDQDFVLAHFALGNLCRQQGKQQEAEKHFANALLLLNVCPQDTVLPESDGLTAGRLMEIIQTSMNGQEATA
jgi:chemotaxis protein methyltransferase CheR